MFTPRPIFKVTYSDEPNSESELDPFGESGIDMTQICHAAQRTGEIGELILSHLLQSPRRTAQWTELMTAIGEGFTEEEMLLARKWLGSKVRYCEQSQKLTLLKVSDGSVTRFKARGRGRL